jgi:hypothetical protein
MRAILSHPNTIMVSYNKVISAIQTLGNSFSTFPKWMFFTAYMFPNVFPSSKDCEIFNSIIGLIPVDMVDYFFGSKRTSKMLTHYQTMFGNISILIGVWMLHFGVFVSTQIRYPIHLYVPFSMCLNYITHTETGTGG